MPKRVSLDNVYIDHASIIPDKIVTGQNRVVSLEDIRVAGFTQDEVLEAAKRNTQANPDWWEKALL